MRTQQGSEKEYYTSKRRDRRERGRIKHIGREGGVCMAEKKRVERFEDLDVWKEGCELAVLIYKLVQEGKISKDYGLKDQMTRAAVSIPANVAEGKERETIAELNRFLYIVKGSAGELRTHLYIAFRVGYLSEDVYANLREQAKGLSRKLGSFIQSLKR
jgi:four helix bundle protein